MSARTVISTVRRRLLGVALLTVIVLFLWLTVAIYQGRFTPTVTVSLRTDHVGNQLLPQSDVKVRGLVVGEVREIRTNGDGAVVVLDLHPDKVHLIPRNTTARLLPKTLFGERYVALVPPAEPADRPLTEGDVIEQDHSPASVELEQVLGDLMPLLQALEPEQLASTLSALSTALDGRGEQLGTTLVRLGEYLRQLNPELPTLTEDIDRLADFADTYAEAAPDLLQALDDLTVTSRTVFEQREQLQTMLGELTTTAGDLQGFLEANRNNLIRLADTSRPTLELLAKYAPEYPCLLKGLAEFTPRIEEAFGKGTNKPGLHITLEITANRGKYEPGKDTPRYEDKRGPRCYDFAEPPEPFPQYPPDGPIKDGSTAPPAARTRNDGLNPPLSGMTSTSPAATTGRGISLPNSPAEQEFLAALLASATDMRFDEVPRWSSLLVGPLYRGAEVTLR